MQSIPSYLFRSRKINHKPNFLAKAIFKCRLLKIDPGKTNSIISRDAPPLKQEYGERLVALGPEMTEKVKAKVQRKTSSSSHLIFSPDDSLVFALNDHYTPVPRLGGRREAYVGVGMWSEPKEVTLLMHHSNKEIKIMSRSGMLFHVGVGDASFSEYTFEINPADLIHSITSFEVYFSKP